DLRPGSAEPERAACVDDLPVIELAEVRGTAVAGTRAAQAQPVRRVVHAAQLPGEHVVRAFLAGRAFSALVLVLRPAPGEIELEELSSGAVPQQGRVQLDVRLGDVHVARERLAVLNQEVRA